MLFSYCVGETCAKRIGLLHLHFIADICTGFNGCKGFFRFFSFEKSFLKEQKSDDANGDRCICDIKDRAKEFKLFAAPERNPFWKRSIKNGEVKHINHTAM